MGFPRQECWRGLPSPPPGDLPNPGIELTSPESLHWQVDFLLCFLTTEPPGKAPAPRRGPYVENGGPSRTPVVWKQFGRPGPDNRTPNGLGTSFQGPRIPETFSVTSPKSQRGKRASHLISPLLPLEVFIGTPFPTALPGRKQTLGGCRDGGPEIPGHPSLCVADRLARSVWGPDSTSGQDRRLF